MKFSSAKIGAKQKRLFQILILGVLGVSGVLIFSMDASEPEPYAKKGAEEAFEVVSQEVDPQTVRLSTLEQSNDEIQTRLDSLEDSITELKEDSVESKEQSDQLLKETHTLVDKIGNLEKTLIEKMREAVAPPAVEKRKAAPMLRSWERPVKKGEKHVAYEIPAGTVLKAVLVSGADCSVAVHKPTGPNMVLLRPLDNGQLPRNVRVPLKGSIILGNAIGDISSERVYVRGERMTLVETNGSFIETEISAYVSGEDGREGLRGVVVDRSGQIITRAAFAATLQGIGQGAMSAFQLGVKKDKNENVANPYQYAFGNAGMQGGASAMGKMSEYFIKRAEQLQPAIQIAAGRVVDVVFTKTVKIGEKDLKKKFDMEREAKRRERE